MRTPKEVLVEDWFGMDEPAEAVINLLEKEGYQLVPVENDSGSLTITGRGLDRVKEKMQDPRIALDALRCACHQFGLDPKKYLKDRR